MVLSTEQRILYDNLYCAYKIKRESKIECRHPYSFRIHDLELCPIVQDYFANIIFQEDGIYLIIKKPSKDSVSGTWDKIFLDIKLDNKEEIKKIIEENLPKITNKNRIWLFNKLDNIYERFNFLKSRGREIAILEKPLEVEEETEEMGEEESETEEEELPDIEVLDNEE